jgi:hypothetical protein
MFLDAIQAFDEMAGVRGIELVWDESGGHIVVTIRLGRPAASEDAVAAALSAANSDLGVAGFRLDGDQIVFSIAAFLDPDGRISSLVLQRLVATAREAVGTFTA